MAHCAGLAGSLRDIATTYGVSIRQSFSASQMCCLGRFLPLLIGDFILEDDYWENFLTLLDIVDYVFAPVTTHRLASHISLLVEDFLTEFSKLYGRPLTALLSSYTLMDY